MKRALYLLDQLRDVVQGKPRPAVAEIARAYFKSWPRVDATRCASPRRSVSLRTSGKGRAFAPVLLAHTVLLSAVIAGRIWHEGAVLPDFKLEIFGIVAVLIIVVLLPQTFFVVQLERAWRAGSREYGALSSRYVEGFRQKWLAGAAPENESLVDSSDIQSLADLADSFAVVREMRLLPFSTRTVVRLGVLIALPLLPLALTMIPLDQMIDRAIKVFI